MRLRDLIEHIREREHPCLCCHHRYTTVTDRFDHVLRVYARDFDEAVEILDGAIMPLFDENYVSGLDGVTCWGDERGLR